MALAAVGLKTQIYNNHLKSVLLLAGFPLLLALMLGAFFAGLDVLAQPGPADWQGAGQAGIDGILMYGHYAVLAAGLWFVIAWFFHGNMIRAAANSRPITRAEMPKIYNMLENLCISRGIPMPAFDIIDTDSLNAFASGLDKKSYRITLTRGIIDRLSDDELEAVIAHELTHILNRDVRLLIVSVIFVGIISFLAEMAFRSLMRSRPRGGGRQQKGGAAAILLAFAVLAVGYALALVIRFALSRKREYLADAGAVELTKNPEGMMRALLKISGKDRVAGMPDEVQQMCIENSAPFMGIFATHPSIDDRVRAIAAMTGAEVPVFASAPAAPARKGPWG